MTRSRNSPLEGLADAIALWRFDPDGRGQEIVDAAVEALVGGVDSPTLRELAGVPGNESQSVLAEMVDETAGELGVRYSLEPTVSNALEAMARRMLAGRVTPGELTSWVLWNIGPEAEEFAQPFLHIGWMYTEVEMLAWTNEDLDRTVIAEAESFLAGEPSAWLKVPINMGNLAVKPKSFAARIRHLLKQKTRP